MRIAALLLAPVPERLPGAATPPPAAPSAIEAVRRAAVALIRHASLLQPVGDAVLLDAALSGLGSGPAILRPPVGGSTTRQNSVRAGLEALDALPDALRPELVLVHDGVQPCVAPDRIERVAAALATHDGAVPAASVPAGGLVRLLEPQGFRFAVLRDLYRAAAGHHGLSEAALLGRAGRLVAMVGAGEAETFGDGEADMARLQPPAGPLPRTGIGYDVHAFADNRALMLCGIAVPHERGLAGHSDADVGIHALCDAIYGALAEGDIGRHFPPSDADWKDADSARFLVHAGQRIAARGGMLVNADVTLICERPKIGPHAGAMRERLAGLLGVGPDRISVKATTTERLGFTGRSEGIAAQACATVLLP